MVTVNIDDTLVPSIAAIIVVDPANMVVIVNAAVERPAAMTTGVGTVATATSLLESTMLAPPARAAPVRLTVPRTEVPTDTVDESNPTADTADTADVPVGAICDPDSPQFATAKATVIRAASVDRLA